MATEPAKATPTVLPTPTAPTKAVPTFTFSKQECETHLNKLVAFQEQFAGKPNHNPFLWIKKNVSPLYERLTKGETTQELQDAILALPLEKAPVVNPHLLDEQPAEKPKIQLTASGSSVVLKPAPTSPVPAK